MNNTASSYRPHISADGHCPDHCLDHCPPDSEVISPTVTPAGAAPASADHLEPAGTGAADSSALPCAGAALDTPPCFSTSRRPSTLAAPASMTSPTPIPHRSVVVVGSINCDITLQVSEHPTPGETVLAHNSQRNSGGKGANQAVAAGIMGTPAIMIGAIGADDNGRFVTAELEKRHVDLQHVITTESPTGSAYVTVSDSGKNSIVVVRGANAEVIPERLTQCRSVIDAAEVVVTQGEIPAQTINWLAQVVRGRLIVNLAPVVPVARETILRADPLIVNEYEARDLLAALNTELVRTEHPDHSGELPAPITRLADPHARLADPITCPSLVTDAQNLTPNLASSPTEMSPDMAAVSPDLQGIPDEIAVCGSAIPECASVKRAVANGEVVADELADHELAQALYASGISSVVVTLGKQGASYADAQGSGLIGSPQVHVVDTTGAGDAFVGALAAALASGYCLAQATAIGAASGAYACQALGAQASYAHSCEQLTALRNQEN
ncbi:ribokinase [Trueperella sp. LYQ143]|uniref:ribokinase n=1 Tax=Trueperella sp. LYQ143 TaxID=3391059 RepID=UPI003983BD43